MENDFLNNKTECKSEKLYKPKLILQLQKKVFHIFYWKPARNHVLIQSSKLATETLETAIQYHDISKRSIKSGNIQMVELYIFKQCKL